MRVEAEEALKEVSEAEEAKHEDDEEMSSYEKERLANIKRNNAFLLNLGIVDTVQPAVTPKVSQISRIVALCLLKHVENAYILVVSPHMTEIYAKELISASPSEGLYVQILRKSTRDCRCMLVRHVDTAHATEILKKSICC